MSGQTQPGAPVPGRQVAARPRARPLVPVPDSTIAGVAPYPRQTFVPSLCYTNALPRGVAGTIHGTDMVERNSIVVVGALLALLVTGNAAAQEEDSANTTARPETTTSICLMAVAAAKANGLPFEFFARLIWQESRFRPDAVGPMTRSGARARGIAQFMPRTASERGLLDPHDPVQALPKSAEFLRELRNEFGNLGLAAAAYNAGPRRVREWLEGRGSLPAETQRYVEIITGHPAEEWAKSGGPSEKPRSSPMTCTTMT